MSKKYFVKYLPVEGEIKEGCMALKPAIPSLGINEPYIEDVNDYDVECLNDFTLPGHKFLKGSKLVKLFLCSRDIQVGDKVFHDSQVPNQGFTWTDSHDRKMTKDNVFKVIGEISPDALSYVKRGQGFDEDDVRVYTDYANTPAQRTTVKVKGPCGHFH